MQAKFVREGQSVPFTPASAVDANSVNVKGGDLVGVAKAAIAADATGALAIAGVYEMAKVTGAIAEGADLYWDADADPVGGTAGTGAITTDPSLGPYAGECVAAALSADETVQMRLNHRPATPYVVLIPIEDLSAGGDISARPVFADRRGGTLVSAALIAQGSFAGIDDSNTMVVLLDDSTNTIVTKTYNTATQPTASAANDLGSLSATHKVLAADEVIRLTITNGATANPPAMLLRLEFKPAA